MKTHTEPAPQKPGAPRAASIEELEAAVALKKAECDRCEAALTDKHHFILETINRLRDLAAEEKKAGLRDLAKLTSASFAAVYDRSRADAAIIDYENTLSEFINAISQLNAAKKARGNGATA